MRKKENFLYSLAASERERGRERERGKQPGVVGVKSWSWLCMSVSV